MRKKKNESSQENLTLIADTISGFSANEALAYITAVLEAELISKEEAIMILDSSGKNLRNMKAMKEFNNTGLGKQLQ